MWFNFYSILFNFYIKTFKAYNKGRVCVSLLQTKTVAGIHKGGLFQIHGLNLVHGLK